MIWKKYLNYYKKEEVWNALDQKSTLSLIATG